MRILNRIALAVSCFALSASAVASIVHLHTLTNVRLGGEGEILVVGTMGWLVSTDGGKSWARYQATSDNSAYAPEANIETTRISKEFGYPLVKASDDIVQGNPVMDSTGRLFACSSKSAAIKSSDDGGATWVNAYDHFDTGNRPDSCEGIAIISDVVYVMGRSGFYRSGDGGIHWTINMHEEFAASWYSSRAPFGDARGVLYANGAANFSNTERIFRSKDRGLTWHPITGYTTDDPRSKYSCHVKLLRVHGNDLYFTKKCSNITVFKGNGGKRPKKLLEIPSKSTGDHSDPQGANDIVDIDIGRRGEIAVLGNDCLYLRLKPRGAWIRISDQQLMNAADWYIGKYQNDMPWD